MGDNIMKKCANCTFLDPDKCYEPWDKRYWCEEHHEWKYADEEACYRYCSSYNRSESVANSLISASRESQSSSGCYLTTITCQLLGLPDNNMYLQTLRSFRDEVMHKELKYFGILVQYDVLGPKISRFLSNDPDGKLIAEKTFEYCIKPVVSNIIKKRYDEAIEIYTNMTEKLLEYYRIKTETVTQQMIDSMDIEKSGHGKLVLKQRPIFN